MAARRVCQQAGVQFLDETVSQARLRLRRDDNQRATLYREFVFEFSDTGDNRLPGRVYLLGNRILDVNLILAGPAGRAASAGQRHPFPAPLTAAP